jgi:hypothetical protein
MASIREDRPRLIVSEAAPGRKSMGMLVLLLVAVLAAIALIWNASRRHASPTPTPVANVEPAPPPPAAEPAPMAAARPVAVDDEALSARKQAEIARVISDGRPRLKVCYQRALTRDDTLVYGDLTIRLAIAASGKVQRVHVAGPAAFRALEPCLETAISKWSFPSGSEPYAAAFPLALRGNQ